MTCVIDPFTGSSAQRAISAIALTDARFRLGVQATFKERSQWKQADECTWLRFCWSVVVRARIQRRPHNPAESVHPHEHFARSRTAALYRHKHFKRERASWRVYDAQR